MKININLVKVVPKSINISNRDNNSFAVCVYGQPSEEIEQWINYHQFKSEYIDNYTNIFIPNDTVLLSDIFLDAKCFEWMDSFSPNLNKELHIGHFSNLVLGKSFKSLGICKKTVSIYGDTLNDINKDTISKAEALIQIHYYLKQFEYTVNKILLASQVKYSDKNGILKDGTDKYQGCKIFEIDNSSGNNDEPTKIVAVKSDGSSSYFYQDVALCELLNSSSTLYLTGKEQCNHFLSLKQLYPGIEHIGLGLVNVFGNKMSSRKGNVILIKDFIQCVQELFDNNIQLVYNVFAGYILKSSPEQDKEINSDYLNNPKNSSGLYISYTTARLISAGCDLIDNNSNNKYTFISKQLEFAYLKSKFNLKPNILFESLVEHCKLINSLYATHIIKDNSDNKNMFNLLLSDLIYGCKKLGLFIIEKV